MKLKEYIENLQQIVDKEWDLEIIYSKDDEWNEYQKVIYEPSIFYIKPSDYYVDEVYKEDEDEIEDDMIKAVCIN